MRNRAFHLRFAAAKAVVLAAAFCSSLHAWTITAVSKGPNQINLTWPAQNAPGYGYIVEIQSPSDSRYSVFTELQPVPSATGYTCDPTLNWHGLGTGCNISDPTGAYVYNPRVKSIPAWVTDAHYIDPQDGTAAQFIAAGLKNNTLYNFRVRTYTGNTNPTYGTYSSNATATTANYVMRYVSTTGNDGNDGTAPDDAHAWHSIGMAGSVACGTLVLVKGGDYSNEYFGLGQACSPAAKVVLQANYGELARIITNAHPDWGSVLNFYGSSLVVDGIGIAENGQPDYVVTVGGSRNALFNMNIGPTAIPSAYGGVTIHGNLNLVYGNYIHDAGSPYYVQNASGNGGFPLELDFGASNNTVWSNHITRGSHDCTLVHNASSNKFLNNIADGGWGMAFETVFQASQDNLFEGVISVNAGALEANIYKPAFELSYKSNTVRRSIFVNAGKAIEISAYDDTTNNLVYNNVFYNVARCYFQSHNVGVAAYDGVKVQNNICQYTWDATEIYLNNSTPKAISYNSFFKMGGDGTDASVVWNQDAGAPYAYPVTLSYAEANYGNGAWFHNAVLSTAPAAFVDPDNMDFHLRNGSPLIAAGTQVTDPDWGFPFDPAVDLGTFGLYAPGTAPGIVSIKSASSLALASSMNPSTAGQSVTFSATVSPLSATGTIQFLDGTTLLGTVAVSGGAAQLTTSALTAGTHNISASYSGDALTSSASNSISQVVNTVTSSITLTSSLNPSTAGQSVTYSAAVSPLSATGTIQFLDGATLLGTVAVSGGAAQLTTIALTAGIHNIKASYSGDALTSTAATTISQLVKALASVALSTSSASPAAGQPVQLIAAIAPTTATGTVQFLEGATVLGTVSITNGTASLTLAKVSLGTHNFTASYAGDSNDSPANSPVLSVTIVKAVSSVVLTSSLNPATTADKVTFTATVSPATAKGVLQFLDGTTVLRTITFLGGTVSYSVPNLAAGTHSITAVYGGDANDTPATSPIVVQQVVKK